ncbi:MAG: hypothetical protein GY822_13645, partial [Deltaproteobacteria bacterium]|nr:hypothetical protein [Deltaproteobacteria bacterium]
MTGVFCVVLDPNVLQHLQGSGFSLGETREGVKASKTSLLYKKLSKYRDFADTLGIPLHHVKKTDQLPKIIPAASGDIPEMVRLFRNFEDKGARSKKDKTGGFFIRHLSNNSQHPYRVEYDGDEPRHFDTRCCRFFGNICYIVHDVFDALNRERTSRKNVAKERRERTSRKKVAKERRERTSRKNVA